MVVVVFLLVNFKVNFKFHDQERIHNEERSAFEEDHNRALGVLELDNRQFIIYEDQGSDDQECFLVERYRVDYISKQFK